MSTQYLFPVDPPSVADSGDEVGIQTRFRTRMKMAAPSVRLFAIPNAGKRTAWSAMQVKREGLVTGFPDIGCHWEGGIAFVEFKTRTGALSNDQIRELNQLHANGHPCGVFRSADTAIAWLRSLGAPFLAAAA
jgi:hypothetical protein